MKMTIKESWSEEDEKTLNSILSCIKHCQDEDIEARYNGNRNVDPKRYESMSNWLKSLKDRVQPKQEWSKEDEKILDGVITNYESGYLPSVEKRDEIIEKLESIKDRLQPQQKQEWSEKDERMRCLIISHFESHILNHEYITTDDKVIKWLRILKHRLQWKPSDEQMDALRYVTNFDYGGHKTTLVSLYEQLKNLKG